MEAQAVNLPELQQIAALVSLLVGFGVGYGSLQSRVKSLEDRVQKIEEGLIKEVGELKIMVARIEERIKETL